MDTKFLDTTYTPYCRTNKWCGYNDVEILYQHTNLISPQDNRIDTSVKIGKNHVLRIPYIQNNTIFNKELTNNVSSSGGLSIINPLLFSSIDEFLMEIKSLYSNKVKIGFNIGIHPDDVKLIDLVLEQNPDIKPLIYIWDTESDNNLLITQIRKVDAKYKQSVSIIAGYINNPVTLQRALLAGAVGIVTNPQENLAISTIINLRRTLHGLNSNANLIINNKNNWEKSIVAGADIIMSDHNNDNTFTNPLVNLNKFLYRCNSKTTMEVFNTVYFVEV